MQQTSRLFFLAALLGAPCAFAVETKSWVHNEQTDFEKGTLEKLSLRSDGRLALAPAFREILDPSISYLWALAVDSKGTIYTGGGSPGATSAKLMAVDASGKSRTVAEVPGLQIQALAVDKSDRVYVATAPDGKVHRIGRDGKSEVFYDPKAKYIWGLAFNSRGDLFVATGDGGQVHRVSAAGKGEVFFDTEETHARSLAIDAKDNVLVGTEPGGLILRVSPAGEGFVLYQSAKREVTAISVARDGAIYAAALGNKTPSGTTGLSAPLAPQPAPSSGAAPSQPRPAVPGAVGAPVPIPVIPPAIAGGSEVYRISTDNYPQKVWSHAQDLVYAIGFDGDGRTILGTGNKGNIYRIDTELISTLLVNSSPTQVTAFATGPKGRLFAATGNVGKLYQLGPESEKQGTFESEPLDVGFFSYWGRVRSKADAHGGQIRVETRSGNLDRPQKNWSAWAPLESATGKVASPSARFLQYRLTFSAAADGRTPEMREIELAYMARNVAPSLEQIDITPANYRFNASPALGTPSPQTLTLQPLGQRKRPAPTAFSADSSSSQSMQYAKGQIGARWLVSDPNSDALHFKVELRGANEKNWTLLKENLKEKYISWDSAVYPDGEYIVRVTATDAPDNPPDQALTAQLESERFVIDNSAPQISNLTGARSGAKMTFKWSARDERSVIRKAEYSRNGGEWIIVEPTTRLSDAPEHDYAITLDASTGEQTFAVRVTDDFDNVSVAKTVLR